MKDRRVKCCPNENCEHNRNRKKHLYNAKDRFCTSCGSELVFACAKCFGPISDDGPKHKICMSCEAKAEDRKEKVRAVGGKIAAGACAAGAGAAAFVRKDGVKKVVEIAAKIKK